MLIPCAVSARHTGTMPNTPRTEAMNAQITAVAGLPPGRYLELSRQPGCDLRNRVVDMSPTVRLAA
jgi:hypothetical protein